MNNHSTNKIIYFDKETMRNILEEKNKGSKSSHKKISNAAELRGEISAEAKVKLDIPFIERLGFLFFGKLKTSFLIKRDSSTSITSTEISEFESIEDNFTVIKNTLVTDLENSSTFFRVAGTYLRIVEGGVEGVNIKEFMDVMDSQDGYDTYKVDDKRYVRFNNTAFLSNYKRNELLATNMTIYCIPVGVFNREQFDFTKQLAKMQSLYTNDLNKTLHEAYTDPNNESTKTKNELSDYQENDKIELFDVVYACITSGEE